MPSSRRIEEKTRKQILSLYKRKYWDFGPTLACEHLESSDNYVISHEKFNVIPKKEEDLHRPVQGDIILDEVLCFEDSRQVQNDWTVRWRNRFFQLTKRNEVLGLVKQNITVREKLDGIIQLVYKGHTLAYEELQERPKKKVTVKVKQLAKSRKPWKPATDHPWRTYKPRSCPQPLLDSDELVGAHSRRVAAGV